MNQLDVELVSKPIKLVVTGPSGRVVKAGRAGRSPSSSPSKERKVQPPSLLLPAVGASDLVLMEPRNSAALFLRAQLPGSGARGGLLNSFISLLRPHWVCEQALVG